MTIIKVGKHYHKIAQEWNELTKKQFIKIIDIFSLNHKKPEQIILKLLQSLLQMNDIEYKLVKATDLEEYLYLVEFLFKTENYLTRQLIPEYDQLFGPDDEIGNIVMKEFVFSEHFFMQWQEEKENEALLNQFVATIYRPAKTEYDFGRDPDGDCRTDFNANICAWYADQFISKWPIKIKRSIAHWYAGCRQKLVDDNEEVFGGTGDPAKHGLISIIREVAKQGTHGTFESVENINVSLLMIELNEMIEEGKKLEAQMKSAR